MYNTAFLKKLIFICSFFMFFSCDKDYNVVGEDLLGDNNFELKGSFFTLNYKYFSEYQSFEKYGEKLNIEYKEKYSKKIEQYKKLIYNKYIYETSYHNLHYLSRSSAMRFTLTSVDTPFSCMVMP